MTVIAVGDQCTGKLICYSVKPTGNTASGDRVVTPRAVHRDFRNSGFVRSMVYNVVESDRLCAGIWL